MTFFLLRHNRWLWCAGTPLKNVCQTDKDSAQRLLVIPSRTGLREIGVRDSRQASLLGQYWTAVERYRDAGDGSALREFRGQHIVDASGKRVRLLTDLRELDRLGSAGVLSFQSLYAGAA